MLDLILFSQAISNPKIEDLQEKAWQTVTPLVSILKTFFEFSLELGKFNSKIILVEEFKKKCMVSQYEIDLLPTESRGKF